MRGEIVRVKKLLLGNYCGRKHAAKEVAMLRQKSRVSNAGLDTRDFGIDVRTYDVRFVPCCRRQLRVAIHFEAEPFYYKDPSGWQHSPLCPIDV